MKLILYKVANDKSAVCHGSAILSADFLRHLNDAHKSWPILSKVGQFLRATAVPVGTAEASISYGNSVRLSVCPSVCLSVTTRWYTKPRWDRDSGSSPYDSLEYLVSNEVIWCHWVRRFPSNESIKEGYPHLEIIILPLLAHLAWKRLQIDTDLLFIITSTADELSSGTNIDDLERPWTPEIGVFSEFLAILRSNTHFKTELRQNCSR